MKLFLCGDGSGEQTIDAIKQFEKLLDKRNPLLYIPLTMTEEKYSGCLEWITNEMNIVGISDIQMVRSSKDLEGKN